MSSASDTPRMSAEQRRAQLLDVTRSLVTREGFHAISIEAVAREAGISRPIVYGHFGDLQGLLAALVQRESEIALGQLASVLPTRLDDDPAERLLAAFDAYLDAAEAQPETWRLVLMPPEGTPALLRDQVATQREAVIAALGGALGATPHTPDPELAARILSTLADEAVRLRLTQPRRYSRERLRALAEWGLRGIGRMRA
jgi:AcrR family transcriptional regulator